LLPVIISGKRTDLELSKTVLKKDFEIKMECKQESDDGFF